MAHGTRLNVMWQSGWKRAYIRMTESLFYSPEAIATSLIGYTPIQNEKFKRKKNKIRPKRKKPDI